jgi:ribosomal protein L29
MENTKEDISDLLDNLRDELAEERQEVLHLIDIVHFYESMLLSLNMQVATENLNSKHSIKAIAFAEKVSNKKLDMLYSNQNSLSGLDKDFFDIFNPLNKNSNDKKLH